MTSGEYSSERSEKKASLLSEVQGQPRRPRNCGEPEDLATAENPSSQRGPPAAVEIEIKMRDEDEKRGEWVMKNEV